jgi:hypothetical protein
MAGAAVSAGCAGAACSPPIIMATPLDAFADGADGSLMHEDLVAGFADDETEALGAIEPLHRAGGTH